MGEAFHLINRDSVRPPHLHCPGDSDGVGGGGAELAQGSNIDGSVWGFLLTCWRWLVYYVRQRTDLPIYLHRDILGEVVHLVAACV